MNVFLTLLLGVLLGICLSEGKRKETVGSIVSEKTPKASKKSLPIAIQSVPSNTTARPTTAATAKPTRRALRRRGQKRPDERRCCKLGFRAGLKGYFCHLDVYFAVRYLNMEHRTKMKFFGRKPSKRTQRFVRHIERHCIKRGMKSTFHKCCKLASKR